jgi:hypothetical protein
VKMTYQNVRFLFGWMDQDEARAQLSNHVSNEGEPISSHVQSWNLARLQVLERAIYSNPTPVLSPLPAELSARGAMFLNRQDVKQAFQGMDYAVGIVDLTMVLAFQKAVTEEAVNRLEGVDLSSFDALFSLCLPEPSPAQNLAATADIDWKGISFSSTNPNLRVVAGRSAVIDGLPFYGFAVGYGLPFIQVVEYEGRWFIRDGYHRCYALLCRGITRIPCLFIRAANGQQFGGFAPQFFARDIIFGPRPPFLADFLNDDVAVTVSRYATGKVVRIVAQEFNIQL